MVKTKTISYTAIQKSAGNREEGFVHRFHSYQCSFGSGLMANYAQRIFYMLEESYGTCLSIRAIVHCFCIVIFLSVIILKIVTLHARSSS